MRAKRTGARRRAGLGGHRGCFDSTGSLPASCAVRRRAADSRRRWTSRSARRPLDARRHDEVALLGGIGDVGEDPLPFGGDADAVIGQPVVGGGEDQHRRRRDRKRGTGAHQAHRQFSNSRSHSGATTVTRAPASSRPLVLRSAPCRRPPPAPDGPSDREKRGSVNPKCSTIVHSAAIMKISCPTPSPRWSLWAGPT